MEINVINDKSEKNTILVSLRTLNHAIGLLTSDVEINYKLLSIKRDTIETLGKVSNHLSSLISRIEKRKTDGRERVI